MKQYTTSFFIGEAKNRMTTFDTTTKDFSVKFNKLIPNSAYTVLNKLEENGYEAYLVGGCVRDALLNKKPHDWDVTTDATPQEMLKVFSGYKYFDAGLKHGTVSFLVDDECIEVTMFRKESEYSDGRHPDKVEPAKTVEEDLSRRDFTVNAIAYSLSNGLVDPFDGYKDLNNKTLKCVGKASKRFTEDGLRLMRALRFASVLDFDIEKKTCEALKECTSNLDNVSIERVSSELMKMLASKNVSRTVELFDEYHQLLFKVLPELEATYNYNQNNKFHNLDLYTHSLTVLKNLDSTDSVLRLAALMHDVGKPHVMTLDDNGTAHYFEHATKSAELCNAAAKRLRLDNATCKRLVKFVEYHESRPSRKPRSVSKLLREMGNFDDAVAMLDFMMADKKAQDPNAPLYVETLRELEAAKETAYRMRDDGLLVFTVKELEVSGYDLVELGYNRDKRLGEELNHLLEIVSGLGLPNEKEKLLNQAKKDLLK